MPSVTFSALRYSLPDGSALLPQLDVALSDGLTGLVGRNGAGKSTLLRLVAGDLQPGSGSVTCSEPPRMLVQAPEPSSSVADLFPGADALAFLQAALAGEPVDTDLVDWTLEDRCRAALARMGLPVPLDTPLARLSGGQVRRAALAALGFDAPGIVLLDEPTNDLDADGREAVAMFLEQFRGLALVASHDRALLERMDRILALEETGATLTGGGYSAWKAVRDAEEARAAQALAGAEAGLRQARRDAEEAETRRARRARSGKALRADGSQGKMLTDAFKNRAEAGQQGAARLSARRQGAAEKRLDEARARIAPRREVAVPLPSCGLPPGRDVLEISGLDFRWPDGRPVLQGLSLSLRGPERVRLAGPNGSGKSTLLKLIDGKLSPSAGEVALHVPAVRLDQRLGLLSPGDTVLDSIRRAQPGASEHLLRENLARFLFRGRAAEKPVAQLSGGERLRLALAATLTRPVPPQLLMLDEPSNHLDMQALEAVEEGLAAYDGALIVISHDAAFVAALEPDREITLVAPE